jgi:hypothetical protein
MLTIPLIGLVCLGPALVPQDEALPWKLRPDSWRTDAAWYDGQAEKCVYEATRTIYGTERKYLATAYTNKQQMDPATTVKAAGDDGGERVEVFKHHWSERVPTENYDYDFSTVSFTRTGDLLPFKLIAATQEDCGASFKQVWRDEKGELRWLESVYHPGAGLREGRLDGEVLFEDALTLVLRDFPFGGGKGRDSTHLRILRSQKSPRSVSFEPGTSTVRFLGKETLELPVGSVEAFHLGVVSKRSYASPPGPHYWFAADGSAPWLHALVQYEAPDGTTYRLKSLERTAYWER